MKGRVQRFPLLLPKKKHRPLHHHQSHKVRLWFIQRPPKRIQLAWIGILEEAVESDTDPLVLREMVDAETLDNLRAFPPDMLLVVLKSNLPEGSPLLTEKGETWVRKALEVL